MHFKEISPIETVNKLKGILKACEIEVDETWLQKSSLNTYTVRIEIKGTGIGTNGKGISKDFALASGYAEFFERFQNNMLGTNVIVQDKVNEHGGALDGKCLTAEELIANNNSFMRLYFENRNMGNASFQDKVQNFKSVHVLEHLLNNEDTYYSLPFYNFKDGKVEFLPINSYVLNYGSNGMCAGNTSEEAIVQGLSEIIERYIQKRLFTEKPALPDIPEEYIKQFPYIYEMFLLLKENSSYKVMLKDCSFGGKYPVAALIIIEKNTGKYGIKLGCHPDYGIAMERAFTEATQGQDIFEYVNRSVIDFFNTNVEDETNICNSYKIGVGQFPYQLFGRTPSFEFAPVKDVSTMTNAEIANSWINEFINDGYDVLVRNVSHFNFPSFHIIIPGMSEMRNTSDTLFRVYNTKHLVSGLLYNADKITLDNTKYIIGTMDYFSNAQLENIVSNFYSFLEDVKIPFEELGEGCPYLTAMCYIVNKDYLNALREITYIENRITNRKIDVNVLNWITSIKYYLSAMCELKDHKKALQYLESMFDKEYILRLDSLFDDPASVIIKQYPSSAQLENLKENENYKRFEHAFHQYICAQKKNPINQEDIAKLIEFNSDKVTYDENLSKNVID